MWRVWSKFSLKRIVIYLFTYYMNIQNVSSSRLYNRLQRVNGLRSWFNSSSTRCWHCTRSVRSRSACHRVKHYGAARCHAVHHSLSTTDHEEEEEEKTVSFTGMRGYLAPASVDWRAYDRQGGRPAIGRRLAAGGKNWWLASVAIFDDIV